MTGDIIITYMVFILPALLYGYLIIWFTYGWQSLPDFSTSSQKKHTTTISVIIPVRNEEENIAKCLQSIINQDFPTEKLQIIIADDHSTDNTLKLCRSFQNQHSSFNIKIVENQSKGNGKKKAITHAISHASGNLIVTTDADTTTGPYWLRALVALYEQEKPKMILGPVAFYPGNGFFSRFQSLEFLSLIGASAGAAGIGHPIMCNGANLAYEKKAFMEVNGFTDNENQVSGDDIFLMMKIKKHFGASSIKFLKNREAIVQTSAQKQTSGFLNQRLRWVSKSAHYTDAFVIFTAIAVYLYNLFLLISLLLALYSLTYVPLALFLWLIKFGVDLPLLSKVTKFFNHDSLLKDYFPIQLLNVFYTTFIGIMGHILPYKWKGR
ncbi:MAG: glycosyltransferase [Bacteroidales bacterium]|nr:glycosyltransferase [Bacteroidales bacterium]